MASTNRDAPGNDVWYGIEEAYWQTVHQRRAREDRQFEEEYQARSSVEREALVDLLTRRQQAMAVLAKIDEEIGARQNAMQFDENKYKIEKQKVAEKRRQDDIQNRDLFRLNRQIGSEPHRGWPVKNSHAAPLPPPPQPFAHHQQSFSQAPASAPNHRPPSPREAFSVPRPVEIARAALGNGLVLPGENPREWDSATASTAAAVGGRDKPAEGANGPATGGAGGPDASQKTGVKVYANGILLGELDRLDLRNHWVAEALTLPVKRAVEIRPGRKFGPEDLEKIYEPTDNKGAKWLSCMIQATGDVQAHQCVTCTKNNGVFSECVIVGGDIFPRCANCEWNRQGCHGASLVAKPSMATRPRSRHSFTGGEGLRAGSAPTPPPPRRASTSERPEPSTGFTAVNSSASAANKAHNSVTSAAHSETEDGSRINEQSGGQEPPLQDKKPGRKSLPTARTSNHESAEEAGEKRSKGSRKSLPEGQGHNTEAEEDGEEDAVEITKDTLVLKHDGTLFTEPEIMRGVPVEKISPNHPYWDPSWVPLEEVINPILEKWQAKFEKSLVEATNSSSRYLANRQVNRGKSVLRFLYTGPIHPYQIVGKQWITKKLINYDTIHRLVQILDELKKFKIDVTPTQWVRQRLHQKHVEKGNEFKLDEEVDALYHDAKVRYIRKKSGFGNIGRPSGYKMKPAAEGTAAAKIKTRGAKRKNRSSLTPESPGVHEPTTLASEATSFLGRNHPAEAEPNTLTLEATSSFGRSHPTSAADPQSSAAQNPSAQPVIPPDLGRRTSKKHKSDHQPSSTAATDASAASHNTSHGNSAQNHTAGTMAGAAVPANAAAAADDSLDFAGYTTTDSFSGDKVWPHDWRVYQVKTKRMTSNPTVTQYYHWVDQSALPGGAAATDEFSFEHQVLKDVIAPGEVTWGVYKEPYDFHLRLSELVAVAWARDCLKLVAETKELPGVEHRGDVLVAFKRERTKRRFLAFLAKKGVALVRTDEASIEEAWNNMQSMVIPGADDSDN